MKAIILSFLIICSLIVNANDGAFFASGNQLIPIEESQISIIKEILKIERINEEYLQVTVNYTFNNPNDSKEILVGFEAPSPSGDVDGTPINGKHPYISNFEVKINEQPAPCKTSIVQKSDYYKNGQLNGLTEQEAKGSDFNENEPNFFYVYHFKALFKRGTNTINHVYKFKLSSSISNLFEFDYILTAANRWANKQIDDFTLILDLGEYTEYNINRTFFKNEQNWSGATKYLEGEKLPYSTDATKPIRVITNKQPLIFKQIDFHPQGELSIYQKRNLETLQTKLFDYKTQDLPFNVKNFNHLLKTEDLDSFKVLRNLPYARRGYIFSTTLIQKYYESQVWYTPNPNYKADLNALSLEEKEWLQILKENHQ